MKTHLLQRILLLLSLSGISLISLHAEPCDNTDMERVCRAMARLDVIMGDLPEEDPELYERIVRQMRELQRQQREQEVMRFLLGNELFDEIFN